MRIQHPGWFHLFTMVVAAGIAEAAKAAGSPPNATSDRKVAAGKADWNLGPTGMRVGYSFATTMPERRTGFW